MTSRFTSRHRRRRASAGALSEAKVLVDASNLFVGGSVQVAASTIDELSRMIDDPEIHIAYPWLSHVHVEASWKVNEDVSARARQRLGVVERSRRPLHPDNWKLRRRSYDVEFVVCGPRFGFRRAPAQVLGFVDVAAIEPTPAGIMAPSVSARVRKAARDLLSRVMVRRADAVAVETSAMRDRLIENVGCADEAVVVVPNSYNRIFDDPSRWGEPIRLERRSPDEVLFGYVTRAYPHKNVGFLAPLADELHRRGVAARFVLTLNDDEWAAQTSALREVAINLGPQPLARVPRIWEACDAAIFPSLLEAFSVMPLEAMRMERPTFGSDLPFVHATCGDAVWYFDPTDAAQAAKAIAEGLGNGNEVARRIGVGRAHVADAPSAQDRARSYLRLIDAQLRR